MGTCSRITCSASGRARYSTACEDDLHKAGAAILGIEWLQLMQILHLQSYIHIQLIVRFPSLPNLKYSP